MQTPPSDPSAKIQPTSKSLLDERHRRWGEKLRALRKERGLSQAGLASLASVSQSAIADYERDRSAPSIEATIKLVKALKVDISYFIDYPPPDLPAPILGFQQENSAVNDESENDAAYSALCTKLVDYTQDFDPKVFDAVIIAELARVIWRLALTAPSNASIEVRAQFALEQVISALRLVISKITRIKRNSG